MTITVFNSSTGKRVVITAPHKPDRERARRQACRELDRLFAQSPTPKNTAGQEDQPALEYLARRRLRAEPLPDRPLLRMRRTVTQACPVVAFPTPEV